MDKRFWAIIGIIIAVFAGILWMGGGKDDQGGDSANTKPTNHIKGKVDSKVKLVEYGDFQCAYCAQYYPIVEQVATKYQDKIAFQFRNLPLNQTHQNAYAASRAAEAADKQGKFWEMYKQLFENQRSWAESTTVSSIFEGYAKQLGLDVTQFKKDVASSNTNNLIKADRKAFDATGEPISTPTFFLNGKKIQAASVDEFSKLIDQELAKQEK